MHFPNSSAAILRIVTVAVVAPVCAGWTVTRERDPMTDRLVTWSSATSNGATLLVGCLNGRPNARLTWDRRVGWGNLAVSYRVDQGPVIGRVNVLLSQEGRTLHPWISEDVEWLRNAKRVRVQIDSAMFDFDVTSGNERLPSKWGCN